MRQNAIAYAQVRLQARQAERPTSAEWQMIETARDFAQCLDAAKRTSLGPLVTRLSRESDSAALEQGMRDAWAELVWEVASWMPAKWRPALMWMRPLPYLRLRRAAWPRDSLTGAEQVLMDCDTVDIARHWSREFARRLPARTGTIQGALAPLWDRFADGPARPAADTERLRTTLETVFRRRAQEPVAVFAWLGLAALASERLRGALLLALLFPADEPIGVP